MLSELLKCETGVGQGDVLSPNLFNILINDLPKCFEKNGDTPQLWDQYINCLLYADDLVLMSLSESGLQKQLDKLDEYCKDWGLNINISKTKTMIMARKVSSSKNYIFRIDGEILECVKCYKYLGVEIHSNGNFQKSMANLCSRGWKAIFKMQRALKNVNVTTATKFNLFDKLISPILCYNSEVWGSTLHTGNEYDETKFWKKSENLPLEQLHIQFCKNALGVHRKATNAAVRGEVGRYPIAIRIVKAMLRYVKHMKGNDYYNPLLKAAQIECDRLYEMKGTWFYTLRQIFNVFNVKYTNTIPDEYIMNKLLKAMKASYEKYWKQIIMNNGSDDGKLSLYRKIKQGFNMEGYLNDVKTQKFRRALTALRISAHRLEIETGRYSKSYVPRKDRLCSLCLQRQAKCVGDEFHAVMECPQFKQDRDELFKCIQEKCGRFNKLNLWDKFMYLLTCEGSAVALASKYIYTVLEIPRNSPVRT